MTAPTRLAGFAAVLGLAFGGAALAGAAIDPPKPAQRGGSVHAGGGEATHGMPGSGPSHGGGGGPREMTTGPRGLAVSEGGYTLEVDRMRFEPGKRSRFSFRIADARGRVVRDELQRKHDREMHLIVVRRDTAVYRHLHPHRGRDGTWSVQLTLPAAGTYRAYADFAIGGKSRTLGTDLFAPGEFRPAALPKAVTRDASQGFEVRLRRNRDRAGRESKLTFAVTRNGRPVRGLQEYLGAKGHLVALREGDLAYLHVHPAEGGAANEIPFAATLPTVGRYRLFLQFKARGLVLTVDYTARVRR